MKRILITTLLLSTAPVLAQVAPSRLNVPDAAHALAPPKTGAQLPAAAPLPQEPQAAAPAASRLHFTDLAISGAHMLPATAIEAVFASLRDRDISSDELKPALDAVAALYDKAGFPLGRAFVPAQRIEDGVLKITIVEGYVGSIAVNAPNARTRTLVARIAAQLKAERPLTKASLERTILLIQDIPGMILSSRFEGMDQKTGATRLVLEAAVKPVSISFSLDNRSGLAGQPTAPYIIAGLNNLIGTGDQITLTALLSPKPKQYAYYGLSGSTLVSSNGLRAGLDGSWAQSQDNTSLPGYAVKSQFSQLDALARYPMLRTQSENLVLQARSYVTNARYSLPLNGVSTVIAHDGYVAGELSADYSRIFTPEFGIGFSLKVNQGFTDLTGERHTRLLTTPLFSRVRGELKAVWQATEKLAFTGAVMGQYSPNSLFATEEVNFGGSTYGGAFAPAEIAGDKGFGVSLSPEYKIDLTDKWSISPYLIGDYAKVWNKRGDGQGPGELVSAGGGLKVAQSDYGLVALEMDKPLNKTPRDVTNRDFRFFIRAQIGANKLMDFIAGNP